MPPGCVSIQLLRALLFSLQTLSRELACFRQQQHPKLIIASQKSIKPQPNQATCQPLNQLLLYSTQAATHCPRC